jgi:hypothetical protein
MTAENFAYWLKGFFELSESDSLTEKQVKIIQKHLSLVFSVKTEQIGDPLEALKTIADPDPGFWAKDLDPGFWAKEPLAVCCGRDHKKLDFSGRSDFNISSPNPITSC